jgi:FMN phosphatase YigB (HAD superfamily)
MPQTNDVLFLFDVDNTLLDNDRVESDLGEHVLNTFGKEARDRFWVIFEEQRGKLGYVDFIGTLERFRLERIDDPRALRLANWLLDYTFVERLFPNVLAVVRHVRRWGKPVILTDGDGVFQPHKLVRSGLWSAFDGRVLGYVHKEKELGAVQRTYPAKHYVLVDDKLAVLNAVKAAWGGRVTTVFPKQGHYANDPQILAGQEPADITIEHIADLLNHDFSALQPGVTRRQS